MRASMIAAALISLWLVLPSLAGATDAIATAESEAPGAKLEVQELKVGNGVVTMKFALINDTDKPIDATTLIDRAQLTQDYHDASGIYLVDTQNRKKYLVIRDSNNGCLCSRNLDNFAPKSTTSLWARFPAPPDSVQKIGVVAPHFIPLDDVPLQR